jgi:hypothetical protein
LVTYRNLHNPTTTTTTHRRAEHPSAPKYQFGEPRPGIYFCRRMINPMNRVRERRTGQFSAFVIIAVLLLAVSVSCTAVTSDSSPQPTPIVSEQLVAPATPLPTATAEAPAPTETAPLPAPTEAAVAPMPAGWTTFTNQTCTYTISYPAEMQVSGQGSSSQTVAFDLDAPGQGQPNFIYVSVIDQSSPAADGEVIYNYDPAETETLLNMGVGESKAIRDIADVAPWFTYERKADTPVGGQVAQTYENAKPWEFPSGTEEIRYYVSANDCTYLIGGYLDSTNSGQAGAINEELFNQIMATVQIP